MMTRPSLSKCAYFNSAFVKERDVKAIGCSVPLTLCYMKRHYMIILAPYLDQSASASSGISAISLLLQKLFSVVLPMTMAWFSVKDYTEGKCVDQFGKTLL